MLGDLIFNFERTLSYTFSMQVFMSRLDTHKATLAPVYGNMCMGGIKTCMNNKPQRKIVMGSDKGGNWDQGC